MKSHLRSSRAILALALITTATAMSVRAEQAQTGHRPGQVYPDFELPLLDGGKARLSDFRGKKVLLFHFASW